MLDLIRTILVGTERAGEKAIVAAPYAIPERVCHQLATRGLLAGYLAETIPSLEHCDSLIAGWWIDRGAGQWFLRTTRCTVMILLSAVDETALSGSMLMEARLKNVRRIICVNAAGVVTADVDVTSRLARLLNAIPAKVETFECAFEEMGVLLEDRFRLPLSVFDERRVLLISGGLGSGGAERQVSYTASGLSRDLGYEVYVGCSLIKPPHDFFRPYVEAAGAKIVVIETTSPEWNAPENQTIRASLERYEQLNFSQLFHAIFHFALVIRSLRPAVVHTWMDYNNVLAGLAADLVGVPAIVLSGRSVAPDQFDIYQPYMRPGYCALFRRRSLIFLNNSTAGALDYARWLNMLPENIRVVHNGFEFPQIDLAGAGVAVRGAHRIPPDAPVIGSIMRFSEEKRPDLFIEMAELIHRRHPDAFFMVFGAGPMLDELRRKVNETCLRDVIRLPGMTNQVWQSLAAMDIFVLTSRMEGLPNVMVEAQAAGCPVVSPGLGGMCETYLDGKTGLTARSDTAADLAQSVSSLLEDRSLHRQMANAAVLHARSQFGLPRMIAETLRAYHDGRACRDVV